LRRWAVAGALAAAVLVAAAFMLVRPRERGDALYHRAATRESDVLPAAGRSQDFALADAEYVAAAGNLLSALEERKGALPPGSITVIQENLRSIQTALEQIRKALEKDPGNRDLNTLLMATYRKEVDLLQQAARLSDSM
jgi:hypothetical protein